MMNPGYRKLLDRKHREACVRAYGAAPFPAKYKGKCGCGKVYPRQGIGFSDLPCSVLPGERVLFYRGALWSVVCVDRDLRERGSSEDWRRLVAHAQMKAEESETYTLDRANKIGEYIRLRDARRRAALLAESARLNATRKERKA